VESLADKLPPEVAQYIHPDWRKNEAEYWACREVLLRDYRDYWIGFADGEVVASGRSPVDVLHDSQVSGRHPFVTCVGREHEPCRIRRATFPYDDTYPGEALPVLAANPGAGCAEQDQRVVSRADGRGYCGAVTEEGSSLDSGRSNRIHRSDAPCAQRDVMENVATVTQPLSSVHFVLHPWVRSAIRGLASFAAPICSPRRV
jgi:hypothetical protein